MSQPHQAMPQLKDSSTCNSPEPFWRVIVQGFWRVALFNSFIAIVLWTTTQNRFDAHMVYSQGIGLSIWLLIQVGGYWMGRSSDPGGFPTGWRLLALTAFGIGGGFVIGNTIGNLYVGEPMGVLLNMKLHQAWSLFLMTAGLGVVATYYFYNEGKSAGLARELERSQRFAAEAQLKLLQSQLEPHMLFNTLANLRVLIATDPVRATQMLDRLNDYLRATLGASRATTHPLSAEFDRLRDYLELMAVRMGPRLQFALDLPDELREQPVPPLLLQPLVENSIRHGLEPSVAGGQIRVQARRHGSTLTLAVSDTGVGLGEPPIHETGFGLTQVRERLATAYGPDAAIELVANEQGGALARITIFLKP